MSGAILAQAVPLAWAGGSETAQVSPLFVLTQRSICTMTSAAHGRPPDHLDDSRLLMELLRPMVACISSIIGLLVSVGIGQVARVPPQHVPRLSLHEATWPCRPRAPNRVAHGRSPPVIISLYDALLVKGGPTCGGDAAQCTQHSTDGPLRGGLGKNITKFTHGKDDDCVGDQSAAAAGLHPSAVTAPARRRGHARHGRGKRSPESTDLNSLDLNDKFEAKVSSPVAACIPEAPCESANVAISIVPVDPIMPERHDEFDEYNYYDQDSDDVNDPRFLDPRYFAMLADLRAQGGTHLQGPTTSRLSSYQLPCQLLRQDCTHLQPRSLQAGAGPRDMAGASAPLSRWTATPLT